MSIRPASVVTAVIFLLCSSAAIEADGITNPTSQRTGSMGEGISNPSSGGGPPIGACGTGVIDLTTGCTQPMLGGL